MVLCFVVPLHIASPGSGVNTRQISGDHIAQLLHSHQRAAAAALPSPAMSTVPASIHPEWPRTYQPPVVDTQRHPAVAGVQRFSWKGPGIPKGHVINFPGFFLNEVKYEVGDNVYLLPEDDKSPLYVARILRAYEDSHSSDVDRHCIEVCTCILLLQTCGAAACTHPHHAHVPRTEPACGPFWPQRLILAAVLTGPVVRTEAEPASAHSGADARHGAVRA
jgi:hypothetical protein